ncbi:hypothetical protein JXB02_02040 [Candidatus Woesearchaeota archaeon]|nr:hypothetical protein [Candidatus Woesearchaeota archaeon]
MGIFDRLMFWKKDDGLGDMPGLDTPVGHDLGLPDAGADPMGQQQNLGMPTQDDSFGADAGPSRPGSFSSSSYSQPSYGHSQAGSSSHEIIVGKEIEIISSKLDAIRVSIESINQRLSNIERIASGEQSKRDRYW